MNGRALDSAVTQSPITTPQHPHDPLGNAPPPPARPSPEYTHLQSIRMGPFCVLFTLYGGWGGRGGGIVARHGWPLRPLSPPPTSSVIVVSSPQLVGLVQVWHSLPNALLPPPPPPV